MSDSHWLVISYNLPTEPSRYRVSVWRALRKLGALNLRQSMWILPPGESNRQALAELSREIEGNGGESLLMDGTFPECGHEERILAAFNALRDEEYREFTAECGKYLAEIEKEIGKQKFTFAELEEEEGELDKLDSWYLRIAARDVFSAPEGAQAREFRSRIRTAFNRYDDLVFAHGTEAKA